MLPSLQNWAQYTQRYPDMLWSTAGQSLLFQRMQQVTRQLSLLDLDIGLYCNAYQPRDCNFALGNFVEPISETSFLENPSKLWYERRAINEWMTPVIKNGTVLLPAARPISWRYDQAQPLFVYGILLFDACSNELLGAQPFQKPLTLAAKGQKLTVRVYLSLNPFVASYSDVTLEAPQKNKQLTTLDKEISPEPQTPIAS